MVCAKAGYIRPSHASHACKRHVPNWCFPECARNTQPTTVWCRNVTCGLVACRLKAIPCFAYTLLHYSLGIVTNFDREQPQPEGAHAPLQHAWFYNAAASFKAPCLAEPNSASQGKAVIRTHLQTLPRRALAARFVEALLRVNDLCHHPLLLFDGRIGHGQVGPCQSIRRWPLARRQAHEECSSPHSA